MRFLLEVVKPGFITSIHVAQGNTLEEAVTTFIRTHPEGITDKYTVSEIKEAIGEYLIGAALIPVPPDDIPF